MVMDTAITTTPKPPASRPVSSPIPLAVSSPHATSPSAPRSMSTTGCSLSIPVTLTEDSSLTPTSFPALAPATFPPKPNPTRPKTKTKRTMDYPIHLDHHQLSSSLIYFLFIYSHLYFPPPWLLLTGAQNNERNCKQ